MVPSQNAIPITSTITHQALIRALRLSITGLATPWLRRLSRKPISEATSRNAPMPANNIEVCLSMSGMLPGQVQQRLATALEELRLAFFFVQVERGTKADGA
ncbi:hypothetical protein AN403_5518 [Pseudomonas fluorescens]|uniref:Uncharacterized protein n=1 Tax=Pseudomonas fluorescens TaxID=294 RepID=A0A0P8XVY1_PSEFL|nr:hypothetical protein AN403_5518 [Pseudomonas fluorescens]